MTIEQKLESGFYSEQTELEKLKEEIDRQIKELINRLLTGQEQFLGKGQNAEVHYLPDNEKVCFKITIHREAFGKNIPKPKIPSTIQDSSHKVAHSPKIEGNYLAKVLPLAGPVIIPKPFEWVTWESKDEGDTYYVDERIEILAMERLHAVSLREVLDETKNLPKTFEIKRFFSELRKFIERMHSEKLVFHHDLHAGNIMIDEKTGSPCLIDFGYAGDEELDDSYFELRENNKISKFKFKKDLVWVDDLEIELSKYLTSKK